MKQPCKDCPFLKKGIKLSKKRRKGIIAVLLHDGDFLCHKTLDYSSGKPRNTAQSQLCLGSARYLEKVCLRQGGAKANVQYRLRLMSDDWSPEDLKDEDNEINIAF